MMKMPNSLQNAMTEARRQAYLQAMGIDVWQSRTSSGAESVAELVEAVPPISAELPVMPKPAATVDKIAVDPNATPAAADGARRWALLQNEVMRCTQCRLHETRTQAVFGAGSRYATLAIVGDSPGREEDQSGQPFDGAAGKVLAGMIRSMGLKPDQVFVTNQLKCRPPQNRTPRSDELSNCQQYLERQLAEIKPQVILAVGALAAQRLLKVEAPIGKLRTKSHCLPGTETPVVVTYHPGYLVREPTSKAAVWSDLKQTKRLLETAA